MARLQAAIVHSSMQVAPCQPNIAMSITEKPIEASAAKRVRNPVISMRPTMSSAALNRMTPA